MASRIDAICGTHFYVLKMCKRECMWNFITYYFNTCRGICGQRDLMPVGSSKTQDLNPTVLQQVHDMY